MSTGYGHLIFHHGINSLSNPCYITHAVALEWRHRVTSSCYVINFWEPFLTYLMMSKKKKINFLCEDWIEKSVTRDHLTSQGCILGNITSMDKPLDAKCSRTITIYSYDVR